MFRLPGIERWHQTMKNRVLLEKICTNFDFDRKMALETRTKFINDHADKNVVIFGTHFNTPKRWTHRSRQRYLVLRSAGLIGFYVKGDVRLTERSTLGNSITCDAG